MSDRPEIDPNSRPAANWHTPRGGARRLTIVPPTATPAVRKVAALPKTLSKAPASDGAWHLPERTTFSTDDQVSVKVREASPGIRPEDLLAQVLNIGTRPATQVMAAAVGEDLRPEDTDFAPKPTPKVADAEAATVEVAAVTGEAASPLPLDTLELGGLAALGALDDHDEQEKMQALAAALPFDGDDEEDNFSVSEYMTALDLEHTGSKSQDADTVPLNPGDISPTAQAALRTRVEQASQLLPKTVEESAADYAKRMAAQFAGGDAPTLDMPADESASDVAARMARELAGDASQSATVTLTPEEETLSEKFRQTARGVADLRERFQRGEMTQDEVQQRQRDYQIYDERTQDWWMMGIESGVWYRFDRPSNQWLEAQPPVPLTRPATPTATGQFTADEILSGSLPYLPQQGTGQEFSSLPQVNYSGDIGTPIPRPGQPEFDPNMTIVGDVASMNTLPNAAVTMQGMSYVDESSFTMPMQTVPMTPVIDNYDYQSQQASAPDYNYQASPTFEKLGQGETQRRVSALGIVALIFAGLLVFGVAAGVLVVILWYNNTVSPYAEQIAGLATYKPSFQTARILDANGDEIVELNSQDGGARRVIPLTQMSPFVLHAVISAENDSFYDDAGYNPFAIGRAFLENLGSGEITSGASTITQQLARNLILRDTTTSASRKATEIAIALEISRIYSKSEILQLYMNETFFGNQSYGVEAASEFYFGIDAADLNLAQSALLAGIISSPALYDPVVNFQDADAAMRVVIDRMIETGCLQFQHGTYVDGDPFCITPSTFVDYQGERAQLFIDNNDGTYGGLLALQLADVETRRYLPRAAQFKYPHFVNYVQAQVEQAFGANAMFQRGFTIYTTLNPRIQDVAELALRQQVAALVNNGVNTGAVMATDPQTGAIRAMVGSPDFSNEEIDGQVDNTRTWQQPGSAIKAVVYTAALEGGPTGYLTPASILWDVPSSYPIAGQQPYQPVNFSNVFYGPTPLRAALQNSYNVSAVKAYEFIGNDKFVNTAQRMGLNFLPEAIFGLPSALGANEVRLIDMMKVYGTLANNGQQVPLYTIDRITEDVNGTTLEVPLPERAAVTQAITPQIAYLMQNILSDDNARAPQFGARGPLTLANLGIPTQGYVGAKTGKSNDGRDLWTMGFTNNTVVGVWLGTYDNSPTVGVSGSTAPAQIWNRVLSEAITGRAPAAFNNPGGVVQNTICRDTGTLAGSTCSNRTTEIYVQTQPPPNDSQGYVQALNIDSWTGYVANEWCPENVTAQTFANISDPFALNWVVNTPQGRQWAQLVGLPQNLAQAPTVACSQGQVLPSIFINNPSNNQQVTGTLTITGQISAPDFNRYDLEFATAAAPTTFTRITSNTQQFPSAGSTIGTWDTTTVPNGSYILRLAAYSNTSGFVYKTVTVNIANVQPTPTPLPLATPTANFVFPTAIIFGTPSPLPFDNAISTATATLAP